MGIEDQPVVEESTEPPICGFTNATTGTPPGPRNQDTAAVIAIPITSSLPTSTPLEKVASSVLRGNHPEPHTLTIEHLEQLLEIDIQDGLDGGEAARRLAQYGPNKVEGAHGLSAWKILLRQVSNSLTMVLILVMALSFAINDFIEGGVIAAVILLNIAVGFVQDYRAEQTIQSLYALSAPTCKVIRSEQVVTIKAESLVKGDVVVLNVGDIVPADLRLVNGLNLSTDEALLTGESLPISKHPDAVLDDPNIPLGDRVNMLYSASTITRGRGKGIVVATGMDTEVGKIAQLLRANPGLKDDTSSSLQTYWKRVKVNIRSILGLDGTPLQIKLSKFALILFAFAILLAIIVFSASLWNVDDEVLIYGICVGVAVIPESLIAVLTISMAVGTKAMAKGNVIVRKLSALEAVGGVTNICSDKTGTLTQGKMITRKVWLHNGSTATVEACTHPFDPSSGKVTWSDQQSEPHGELKSISRLPATAKKFIECLSLCNNATVTDGKSAPNDDAAETSTTSTVAISNWTAVGEPTEIALHVFAMRFGMSKATVSQVNDTTLLAEHPFDSSCKRMTVVYASPGSNSADVYTKGALEVMLPLLDASEHVKAEFTAKAESLAAEGLRVLCVAHKAADRATLGDTREAAESNLIPLGLAGLYDPPRLETAGAVQKCKAAGISVHMLTGDHIKTATAIAHEVGILGGNMTAAETANAIMPAAAFDALTDAQIDELKKLPLVLARCSPSTKVRMVEAMHRRGAFCVMTGDGVNDSPALKKADVGIAMGLNGSDVAKEAADMVLTDDNFASIVTAVEEGRRLFDNIQKFLLHLLVSNIAQVLLLLIGLAFKDSNGKSVFPLSPIEILWANLITSSFLALGLGLEEAQPDIMLRPPRNLRIGIFTNEIIMDKMAYGIFMGSLCIAAFTSVIYSSIPALYDNAPMYGVLGHDCNAEYNASCGHVYRARATTYATLSFLLLVTAWEVKHFTRSLFNMYPELYSGPFSVFNTVWKNKFLFGAVLAGFAITFPVIYLPVIDRTVFKHQAIGIEWAIVIGCVIAYIALVEIWKAGKRRFGKGIVVYGQPITSQV
ncbi:potassium/sodium eff [Hypomontagnella monticulosa]|nr:potassium/sodium eff [Hypomontagnella monticulosa]